MTDAESRRKSVLLRLDHSVHDALARWAADELRSTNAQIEFLLRRALSEAGRMPSRVGNMPRRGRPRKSPEADKAPTDAENGGTGGRGAADGTGDTEP